MSKSTRSDRRERYNAVLDCIDGQTSPVQLPGVRPETIKTILAADGRYDADGVDKSIQAAVEQDDLVVWRDGDGRRRVTLRTESKLRRLATHLAEELEDTSQLGAINQVLAEVADE